MNYTLWYIFGLWDKQMPEILSRVRQHNACICPEFQDTLFQKENIQEESWKDLFEKVSRKVVLADLARYYLMWKHGGFYLDLDVRANRNLKDLVDLCVTNHKRILLFNEHDRADPRGMGPRENKAHTHRLYNCMFWSQPNEDFWKRCYDLGVERCRYLLKQQPADAWTDADILWASGPDVVTTVYHETPEKEAIQIVNHAMTQRWLTHLQTGTWKRGRDLAG
jgi:mannosyltransferase OCH1-like enzyme